MTYDAPPTTETPRILVVDDSPTILSFAKKTLTEDGYEVATADNIFVSTLVMNFRPHLVLMDVHLGASMGTIAVSALRRCGFAAGTMFALYSSTEEQELKRLAAECGADTWFRKTENATALSIEVQKLLAEHSSRLAQDDPSREPAETPEAD